MPFLEEKQRFRGIALPPSGWVLTLLLVVYIFTGLIGHDPWKHDDAISIGIAYDIAEHGNWLTLQLAGRPYPDAPLYYWIAATLGRLFSWLLPFHDAARLASGIFTLLTLEFILLAARELHGKDQAAAAPLILAGSIGFLFHAHEAQPMLAALTAHTAAYWGLTLLPRARWRAGAIFGCALAFGFLVNGLLPILTLVPVAAIILAKSDSPLADAGTLLAGILVGAIPCGLWLAAVNNVSPEYLASFFQAEITALTRPVTPETNLSRYLGLLLWYAWPALPLAAWALWSKRRMLSSREIAIPAVSFFAILTLLVSFVGMRSAIALLLLPPLVLLAVPGIGSLRRGAANAFNWFGMTTFTLFAAIAWIGWSAQVFGWPERLAQRAVRLHSGFVGEFDLLAFGLALTFTGIWFWMIVTTPRSPMRSIMHWMAGLTLFWLLLASLWMPWIDYGKTFRAVSASLKEELPVKLDCVAGANLPLAFRASLDYFEGIRTLPQKSDEAAKCSWLLVQGNVRDLGSLSASGWKEVWSGNRPSDRRSSDKFHLFKRARKANPPPSLTNLEAETPPPDALTPTRIPAE